MSKKIIRAEISNNQLDALEDLLYCELTKKEEEIARKKIKKLWQSLVEAYEKAQIM